MWILQNLNDNMTEAFNAAAQIVGNRSAARPSEGEFFFGPGDGTVSVMVRKFPLDFAKLMFPNLFSATPDIA